MSQATIHDANGTSKNGSSAKKTLKVVGDLDIEQELARFEAEERARLGLDKQEKQWLETMANAQFTAAERPKITLLIAGLTLAHDYLIEGALKGLGYNVMTLECPTNEALRFGRKPVQVTVLRLGWDPKASSPTLVSRLFKRREETKRAQASVTRQTARQEPGTASGNSTSASVESDDAPDRSSTVAKAGF